jgi:predicted glycosyltransferase
MVKINDKNKSRPVMRPRLQVNAINGPDARNICQESVTEDDCRAANDYTVKPVKLLPILRKTTQPRSLKVALYSHDTMGLGHTRRNMTIARTLAGPGMQASVLMITGANIATGFEMPQGVDCLTLPAIRKDSSGNYRSNTLDLPLRELISLRAKIIRGAVEGFEPDVLIVDNVPRGAKGELDETLEFLRSHGDTRCVLGLRDILDTPDVVRNEWQQRSNEDWIRRYYDSIWVYGDPAIYDLVHEYGFSGDIASKVRYTGYLDRCPDQNESIHPHTRIFRDDVDLPPGEMLLCMAGGGQDGGMLARMVCDASLPPDIGVVVLTGELHSCAATNPKLQILEFHPEPTKLLAHADHIISMGGYNTVSEILSLEKRALIVPRVSPRREQLIRANRFESLGLIDVAYPGNITPELIASWVKKGAAPLVRARQLINFNGLSCLPALLDELLEVREREYCASNRGD